MPFHIYSSSFDSEIGIYDKKVMVFELETITQTRMRYEAFCLPNKRRIVRKLHNRDQQFKWYQTRAQTQRIIAIIYRMRVLVIEYIDFPFFRQQMSIVRWCSLASSINEYNKPFVPFAVVLYVSPYRRHGLLLECLRRRPLDFLGLLISLFLAHSAGSHHYHSSLIESVFVVPHHLLRIFIAL